MDYFFEVQVSLPDNPGRITKLSVVAEGEDEASNQARQVYPHGKVRLVTNKGVQS